MDARNGTAKDWFVSHWKGLGIFALIICFTAALLIHDPKEWRCIYVITAMFIAFLTEIYPLQIAGMLPIAAWPLMNIMASNDVCQTYFKEPLVMFIIALILACSMDYTGLNNRIGLSIIRWFGPGLRSLHFNLVFISATLSIFLPNGIAAAFSYPVMNSIMLQLNSQGLLKLYVDESPEIPKTERRPTKLAICFYLSVAYSISIGGMATILSDEANSVLANAFKERYPYSPEEIDPWTFVKFAYPQMLVTLLLTFLVMEITHMGLFRSSSPDAMSVKISDDEALAAMRTVKDKIDEIGVMTFPEYLSATLISIVMFLVFTRDPLAPIHWSTMLPGKPLLNASCVTISTVLVFCLPSSFIFLKCWNEISTTKTSGILTWKFTNNVVPWGLIFVLGCSGAIADGIKASGLTKLLGEWLSNWKDMSPHLSLLLVLLFVLLFTNLMANGPALSVVTPAVINLAIAAKVNPFYFIYPVGLMGSAAYLLPTAAYPNALMAAGANIRSKDVFIAGIIPSIVAVLVFFLFSQSWAFVIFDDLLGNPEWMNAPPPTPPPTPAPPPKT